VTDGWRLGESDGLPVGNVDPDGWIEGKEVGTDDSVGCQDGFEEAIEVAVGPLDGETVGTLECIVVGREDAMALGLLDGAELWVGQNVGATE